LVHRAVERGQSRPTTAGKAEIRFGSAFLYRARSFLCPLQ
jgi:hypothetical protein